MCTVTLSGAHSFLSDRAFCPIRKSFSDGEISLDFSAIDFSAKSFTIVQSLFGSSDFLLELLFAIEIISRNSSAPIHILLPYMAYSRQDREISKYHPISSKVIADVLSSQKVSTISVVDLHSPQIQCFFQKPCFNISLKDFFLNHIRSNFDITNVVICSADIGGAKAARLIADELGTESAIVEKVRSAPGVSKAMCVVGNVKGKVCIIIDDIIDSAGTLSNAANIIKSHGAVSVIAYATHGVFSGKAFENIANSTLEKVFVSNTIPSVSSSKIKSLDASDFILEGVKKRIQYF